MVRPIIPAPSTMIGRMGEEGGELVWVVMAALRSDEERQASKKSRSQSASFVPVLSWYLQRLNGQG